MEPIADTFDAAFSKTVDLANKMADKDKDADLWDIADGLLAGAIQYWLYSRQPCGDSRCQDCMPISTSEGRMSELKRLIEQLASGLAAAHAAQTGVQVVDLMYTSAGSSAAFDSHPMQKLFRDAQIEARRDGDLGAAVVRGRDAQVDAPA